MVSIGGGNITSATCPLVNYLPRRWRDKLAPHVEIYTRRDLARLFEGLPVRFITRSTDLSAPTTTSSPAIPKLGKALRGFLQWLEKTPFQSVWGFPTSGLSKRV